MIDQVYALIDQKIHGILEEAKQPAVIVINSGLYKSLQQAVVEADLSQPFGKVRSPYSLANYKGLQVIPSQVVETVEVF